MQLSVDIYVIGDDLPNAASSEKIPFIAAVVITNITTTNMVVVVAVVVVFTFASFCRTSLVQAVW